MRIQQSSQQGSVVLTLIGRLDLAAAPQIKRAILKKLAEQPPAIICDRARWRRSTRCAPRCSPPSGIPHSTTVPATLAPSYVVTAVGTKLTRGFVWSRGAMESYFGSGLSKRLLARAVNAGVWIERLFEATEESC